MPIVNKVRDILHKIAVLFIPAYLPGAKKRYNAKAVRGATLTIRDLAAKADVYNITTPPEVIEQGMTAGLQLAQYLSCDGFVIVTPQCVFKITVGGEYDGSETRLPEGVYPSASITPTPAYRKYVRENVLVDFNGICTVEGVIAEVIDPASGTRDSVITIGRVIDVRGSGLKVIADALHAGEAWVFFVGKDGSRVRATDIVVNEPRNLKVQVPLTLTEDEDYFIVVVTQSSVTSYGKVLKDLREVRSEFALTAQR